LATIIVERVLDTVMVIALFGLALLLVQVPASAERTLTMMKTTAWFMVGGSIAAMIFLIFFRSNIQWLVTRFPLERLRSVLKNFSEGLSFLDRTRTFALVLVHSVVVWTIIVLQFWFMLLGMNLRFSISAATLVMVGAAIGSIAQVPGIG